MKVSAIAGDVKNKAELESLVVGSVVSGTVHRVNEFGVFVAIKNTSLVGLSRRPMAAPLAVNDLREVYSVGDIVRAKVLSVAVGTGKIGLGLKSSCFDDNDGEDVEVISTSSDEAEDDDDDVEEEDYNSQSDEDDEEGSADGGSDDEMGSDGEQSDNDDDSVEAMIKVHDSLFYVFCPLFDIRAGSNYQSLFVIGSGIVL